MWEPILDGELAARAWAAIDRIADALAELDAPADDLAVFWTYLANVRDDERTQERAERALERFAAAIDRGYDKLSLFEGLAGAGWAAAHIASDAEDLLAVIDRKLVDALEVGWKGPFDLIDGVAGFGVYFLEREGETAARGRELVVDYLASHAEHTVDGLTWRTRPDLLPADLRDAWPNGHYNCGVAHGVPGVLGMLARMAVREDPPSRARQLLAGGVAWLGKQVCPDGFPAHTVDDQRVPSRTAWCYGDAGVVAALHGLVPSPLWTTRTREQTLVRDDGFCHGAAGLTHIANRRYQQTRSLEYQTAARVWAKQLFAYHRPGAGIGGFGHEQEGPRRASILSGSAGIGLVLLALLSDVEPAWDRKLLCDDLDH